MIKRIAFCLLLPAAMLMADVAIAQDGRWMLGLDLLTDSLGEDDDADALVIDSPAFGAALQLGYLFTPSLQLRLYAASANHETNAAGVDLRVGGGTFDLVYVFRPGATVRPFLTGGLGGFRAEIKDDGFAYSAEGPGMSFGAGMHVLLGRKFTFHTQARLEAINWDEAQADSDLAGRNVAHLHRAHRRFERGLQGLRGCLSLALRSPAAKREGAARRPPPFLARLSCDQTPQSTSYCCSSQQDSAPLR